MPITTSRCGVIVDAIIAKLNASPTFADPAKVYDGPNTAGDTQWTSAVFIGFDGNWHTDSAGNVTSGEYESVLINQQRKYTGNTTAQEELEIRCIAEAWSGDPNTQTSRNTTLSLLAGVETVLRTDPTLGIDGATDATLEVGSLYYLSDTSGNLNCRVPFVIHVTTIIPTV